MSQPLEQFQKLLGTSGHGASRPLIERGIDRYEVSSIPAQSSQKNWRYSLMKGGDDSRVIHLDGGNGRTFAFRFDGAPSADQFSSGEAIPLTRLGDSTKHNKGSGGEVMSKGVIQVHKSTPTMIHATLQDGKGNSTVMFEQADGNWVMRGTPKKKRLSEMTAKFVGELSKQADAPLENVAQMKAFGTAPSIAGVRGHGPGTFPVPPPVQLGAKRPGMHPATPAPVLPRATTPSPGSISTTPLKSMVPSPLDQISKVADSSFIGRYLASKNLDVSIEQNKRQIMEEIDPDGTLQESQTLLDMESYKKQRQKGYDLMKKTLRRQSSGPILGNALVYGALGGVLGAARGAVSGLQTNEGPALRAAIGGGIGLTAGALIGSLGRLWNRYEEKKITDEDVARMKEQQKDRSMASDLIPGLDIYDAIRSGPKVDEQKFASNKDGDRVIAVDLDGTLAERYKGEFDPKVIGAPIKSMRRLVRLWTRRGNEVRIFTARAADPKNIPPIKAWLKEHGMEGLKVTNLKTPDIDRFVDDKAIAIIPDTGRSCNRKLSALVARFATGQTTGQKEAGLFSTLVGKGAVKGLGQTANFSEMRAARRGMPPIDKTLALVGSFSPVSGRIVHRIGDPNVARHELTHAYQYYLPPSKQTSLINSIVSKLNHGVAPAEWIKSPSGFFSTMMEEIGANLSSAKTLGGKLKNLWNLYKTLPLYGDGAEMAARWANIRRVADGEPRLILEPSLRRLQYEVAHKAPHIAVGTLISTTPGGEKKACLGGADTGKRALDLAQAKAVTKGEFAYGYPVISPEEAGVSEFLQKNPHVAGMAWGGGENGSDAALPRSIVVNPHNQFMGDATKRSGLMKIEAARHLMGEEKYVPAFDLVPGQQVWRKKLGGPYATDDGAFKQSIVSRLMAGDEVPDATPEQLAAADEWSRKLGARSQTSGQKEAVDISVDQARQGMSAPVYPKATKFLGTLEKRRWQRFGDANEKTPEGVRELQSIGRLAGGAPEVNLLPGGPPRNGFQPPNEKVVQPGWFKQPFYGKSFGSELARANQYRASNPEAFRYEKTPDWDTPVEVNHLSNIGELGGGGAVRSVGKNNEVDLGNPDPSLLRGIGGPVNLLKHEAYHAALEPRDTSFAAPVRNMLQFFDPTSGDRGVNLQKRMRIFGGESLKGNPLAHHDVMPAEMRNYMSGLQEHQFKTTGSRFTSPEQYQDFIKTIPFGDPPKMDSFLKALPYDPARMFKQLDKVKTSTPGTFDKIMDWQAKTIPGYVDATKVTTPKVAGFNSYLKILREKFTAARKDINLNPTKPQIEAQNYRKGHVWMNGFDITIETPKGGGRTGTRPDGTIWKTTMAADYGDIRNYPRSKADGDNMDVFVGPHPSSEMAYVIDQNINGEFDEHKIVLGCFTEKEARAIYNNSFDDKWKGFGSITALTIRQLKSWLRGGDTSKPLAGQNLAKHVKTAMAELDHEEKVAADNSWMPTPLASMANSRWISEPGLAVGSGAVRGALVAALIHGARTLKRETLDEPKRDLNLSRDLLLGTAIGAGSGALLHYTPEIMGLAHNALGSKAAHIMDIPLAPLHVGGGAAPLIGAGYGAIVGAIKGVGGKIKRTITGEPEEDQFIDDVLNSAQGGLNIGSMAALSGMNPASTPTLQAMNAQSAKRRSSSRPVANFKVPKYTPPTIRR